MGRRSVLALVLAAAVAVVVVARSQPAPVATGAPSAAPPLPALLGFAADRQRPGLASIDPQTLEPRSGRRIEVGSEGCAPRGGGSSCWTVAPWSFSPGRSRLALARNGEGVVRSLRIVDVARLRVTTDIALSGGAVGLVAWPARERLLALQEICCEERQQLLVVDAARGRVATRRPLEGTVVRAARTSRELVLLLAPARDVGPARLAVVDGRGGVRYLQIGRIVAGQRLVDRSRFVSRQSLPGLALDPKGRHAFIVDRGLVADVDLASLSVSYHELSRRTSLLGRLRDWLDPPAYAKEVSGPIRSAYWLGGDVLAVAGTDETHRRVRPAGLSLVDTHSWSLRTIDRAATEVRVAGDVLVATGENGLAAYGFDGNKRFRLFDDRKAWVEQVYDGRAYVMTLRPDGRPNSLRVVDLVAGRTTGHRERLLPGLLLEPVGSWWDG
jgi:hypothetical protein